MNMKTLIELRNLLGVKESATKEEIESAFRKKSLRYHPDKGGDTEVFKQLELAKTVLVSPQEMKAYEAAYQKKAVEHINKLDQDLYRAQFKNYQQWIAHSLRLVQTTRSYTRSFFSFKASDTIADDLLKKLEENTATQNDLNGFINGSGGWEDTSTKTLLFELLHGEILDKTPKARKEAAIRWVASLSEPSLNSNLSLNDENEDFLVSEYKKLNSRKLAIDIELSYLNHYLTESQFSSDALVRTLQKEQETFQELLNINQVYIQISDTKVEILTETDGPNATELKNIALQLVAIDYRFATLDLSILDEAEREEERTLLALKQSGLLSTQEILEAERNAALARIEAEHIEALEHEATARVETARLEAERQTLERETAVKAKADEEAHAPQVEIPIVVATPKSAQTLAPNAALFDSAPTPPLTATPRQVDTASSQNCCRFN